MGEAIYHPAFECVKEGGNTSTFSSGGRARADGFHSVPASDVPRAVPSVCAHS